MGSMEDLWDENIFEDSTPSKKIPKKDADLKVVVLVVSLILNILVSCHIFKEVNSPLKYRCVIL